MGDPNWFSSLHYWCWNAKFNWVRFQSFFRRDNRKSPYKQKTYEKSIQPEGDRKNISQQENMHTPIELEKNPCMAETLSLLHFSNGLSLSQSRQV
jgi:hypothetical protein